MSDIFKEIAKAVFIICIAFMTFKAMTMTNNVMWIWFMLFGLFAI